MKKCDIQNIDTVIGETFTDSSGEWIFQKHETDNSKIKAIWFEAGEVRTNSYDKETVCRMINRGSWKIK